MGISAREADAHTLWEWQAMVAGFNRANGGEEEPPALTGKEFDEMVERNATWIAGARHG